MFRIVGILFFLLATATTLPANAVGFSGDSRQGGEAIQFDPETIIRFSKKVENLEAAVALHFMYYNFGRIHKTLWVIQAMEAGIADHVWSLEEIAELTD